MFRYFYYAFFLCFFLNANSWANTAQTVNDYGQLPQFRAASISPSGRYIAYIRRGDDNDVFFVHDIAQQKNVYSANVNKFKARSTSFITDNYAILRGSKTARVWGYRGKLEHSGALAYNIKTGKTRLLLKDTKDIHPAQSGLGQIVGVHPEKEAVYMPAFASGNSPSYNLYRVSLKTGRGRRHARGTPSTRDWFVGESGRVLAREDYNEKEQTHQILSRISGKWQVIYSRETPIPNINVQAIGADGESLLFVNGLGNREALYSMSLHTGDVTGPLYTDEDADIDDLLLDASRKLVAVIYSGFKPSYDFVDDDLDRAFSRLEVTFPASSVNINSWTEDKKTMVVLVSGGDAAGSYYLFDSEKLAITSKLASQYNIPDIGEIKAIRYEARDGLKIPAIFTLPPGDKDKKNLPLIALPHGGPAAYDQVSFDWIAQYLANKGYAVLQPNFRGSTGFGNTLTRAGHGKWGREMQDDISDGVAAVVAAGYVDPARVCIMGFSYGGYAALAGGAFSPELYKCIISVGGVSDLPMMLSTEKHKYRRDHWVINYWHRVIGDSKTEQKKLQEVSPVNFAANFQAPVLLLHGKDDTVVSMKQSKLMHKALEKAGKSSELHILDGEDHWLSTSATRLEMLTTVGKFLDLHNPAK